MCQLVKIAQVAEINRLYFLWKSECENIK